MTKNRQKILPKELRPTNLMNSNTGFKSKPVRFLNVSMFTSLN